MRHFAVMCLILLIPSSLFAQHDWLRRTPGNSLSLEYVSPNFKAEASFFKISGFTLILSGRFALGNDNFLVAEVPYAQTSTEITFFGPTQSSTKSAVANPYIGFEFGVPERSFFATVGIHLPVVKPDDGEAISASLFGDFVHVGRYIPEYVALLTGFNYHPRSESGLAFILGLGPSVWIPTKGTGNDAELLADYKGGAGFMSAVVNIGATMMGQWLITGPDPFVMDSFRHHFQIEANAQIGPLRPAAFLRVPVGSQISDLISNTFGASVSVSL